MIFDRPHDLGDFSADALSRPHSRQRTTLHGEVDDLTRARGRQAAPLEPVVLTPPRQRRAKETANA